MEESQFEHPPSENPMGPTLHDNIGSFVKALWAGRVYAKHQPMQEEPQAWVFKNFATPPPFEPFGWAQVTLDRSAVFSVNAANFVSQIHPPDDAPWSAAQPGAPGLDRPTLPRSADSEQSSPPMPSTPTPSRNSSATSSGDEQSDSDVPPPPPRLERVVRTEIPAAEFSRQFFAVLTDAINNPVSFPEGSDSDNSSSGSNDQDENAPEEANQNEPPNPRELNVGAGEVSFNHSDLTRSIVINMNAGYQTINIGSGTVSENRAPEGFARIGAL